MATYMDTEGFKRAIKVEHFEKVQEFAQQLKQAHREAMATEDFLQNFILKEANIIVIVVDQMTDAEQTMIYKINKRYSE